MPYCYGMFSDSFYPGNHIDFSQLDDTYPETVLPIEEQGGQQSSEEQYSFGNFLAKKKHDPVC
jgi:hypothetical protein